MITVHPFYIFPSVSKISGNLILNRTIEYKDYFKEYFYIKKKVLLSMFKLLVHESTHEMDLSTYFFFFPIAYFLEKKLLVLVI